LFVPRSSPKEQHLQFPKDHSSQAKDLTFFQAARGPPIRKIMAENSKFKIFQVGIF
jgi:hypothetical protein